MNFQMTSLHYPKCSTFGLPQSDAYHMKGQTYKTMCTAVSSNASVNRERNFLMVFFVENCQKKGFLNFCRLFQKLFIRLHKQ